MINELIKELKEGFRTGKGVTREEVEELINKQILKRIAEEVKDKIRKESQ